jgi:hypothetical protein
MYKFSTEFIIAYNSIRSANMAEMVILYILDL